jgi:hypothetical protein
VSSKVAIPEALERIGEHQRKLDVATAELALVRHKARDPLAEGFPIGIAESSPRWADALAWFLRHTAVSDPRVVEVMATVKRIGFVRRDAKAANGAIVDAWHVEAANERGVIFRDVIPTERFFSSWSTSDNQNRK